MRRVLAAAALTVAAVATVPAPVTAAESCQAGRTQVMCQTGRCTGEGGCQIWYCVVWTKGVCVG